MCLLLTGYCKALQGAPEVFCIVALRSFVNFPFRSRSPASEQELTHGHTVWNESSCKQRTRYLSPSSAFHVLPISPSTVGAWALVDTPGERSPPSHTRTLNPLSMGQGWYSPLKILKILKLDFVSPDQTLVLERP